jgi:hypothetical protein
MKGDSIHNNRPKGELARVALMIFSKSPQLSLRKGGTSVMRYEFNPLNKALIGALQDCLLPARLR